jgi:hypothetical protein
MRESRLIVCTVANRTRGDISTPVREAVARKRKAAERLFVEVIRNHGVASGDELVPDGWRK